MRYLLSPDEERRFLRHLESEFKLTPLAPLHSGEFPGNSDARTDANQAQQFLAPHEFVFWASDYGPIRRVSERTDPEDAVGRAMLKINRDAGADESAVDLEWTPIVSWSRTRWFDENRRWIVPSRLGATRAVFKNLSPEYRKMFRSIERFLRGQGNAMNSWDIPNSPKETGFAFKRPRNTRDYAVTIWPEAAAWIDRGVKIYHWDA